MAKDYENLVLNINRPAPDPHQLKATKSKAPTDAFHRGRGQSPRRYVLPLEEVAKPGYNAVFYHGQKAIMAAPLTKETPIAVRRGFPGDDEEAAAGLLWRKLSPAFAMSP